MTHKKMTKKTDTQKWLNGMFMTLTLASLISLNNSDVTLASEGDNNNIKLSSTYLNLRSGAGVKHKKLTTISPHTEVTVVESLSNGWAKVIYQNREYFCSQKYLIDKQNQENNIILEETNPYDNRVIGEIGTNSNIVKQANDYWNKNIPQWLKEKFINSGWNVFVSGTPLKTRFGYNVSIAGITDYETKAIYVDNRKSPVERGTISHELGHFMDAVYGFPSCSKEFYEIFEKEKHNFNYGGAVGDKHEISSPIEYFASVFQDIIIDGNRTKEQIPESYDFIIKYINNNNSNI